MLQGFPSPPNAPQSQLSTPKSSPGHKDPRSGFRSEEGVTVSDTLRHMLVVVITVWSRFGLKFRVVDYEDTNTGGK